MITFNEHNFAEMCREARANARSLDLTDLSWSLLVLVRTALDWNDPHDGVPPGYSSLADAYIDQVGYLVDRHMNPSFRTVKVINKELLQIPDEG